MSLAASRISIPKAFRFKAFCMAFVCGLALPLAGCMIEDADKYVGKDPYTVFPQKFMVGQMDMPLPSGRPSVDWGMTLVWLGEHYMLTVDQNTTLSHDPQVWKIVAVRDIPLLKAGQMFAMGTCREDGKPVPWVVAVVQYDSTQEAFTDIRGAWIYDFHKGAIVDYPRAKLACLNPRYGLGEDRPLPASTTMAPVGRRLPAPGTVIPPNAATKPPSMR